MHVLGVNSLSWHGGIERDDFTLCSAMIVEMWTRKREMVDEDENDVRIRMNMRNQGDNLPDWIRNTSDRWYRTPDYVLDLW
jgi:hypothetical protein